MKTRTFRSPVRAVAIGGLAIALAVAAGWMSAARILGPISPERALWLDSGNPDALTARAEDVLATKGIEGQADFFIASARAALRRSPVDPQALRLMAIGETARNRQARAVALLAMSERLSRRDTGAQLLMIEEAVARGDVPAALDRYDIVLRTTAKANDLLFANLGQAALSADLAPSVRRLFARDPAWLTEMVAWYLDGNGLDAGRAAVFLVLPQRSRTISDGQRSGMVAVLAGRGNYRAAWTLYGRSGGDVRSPLRNPTFQAARFPPFDWQIGGGESFVVEAGTPADPGLHYLGEPGHGGVLAEQVLALAPGSYRFEVDSRQQGDVTWELSCIGGNGTPAMRLGVPGDASANAASRVHAAPFAVPAGCAFQRLRGTSAASGEGANGVVRRAALVRTGG